MKRPLNGAGRVEDRGWKRSGRIVRTPQTSIMRGKGRSLLSIFSLFTTQITNRWKPAESC